MATINPNQDYDIIHTLTFAEASGNCPIRLYQGAYSAISGTVYYRAGTSGTWTSLSVSGTATTFPITDTTMQVAHGWNKSGSNYMTPSFRNATNITGIAISQKSALTGAMGNYFMYSYAYDCSSLIELMLPAVGWFENNNVNWSVPAGRLGVLKGRVLNPDDLSGWQALTAEGKTLHTNYIQDPDLVYYEGTVAPTVTTSAATNVTATSATLNGSLTDLGSQSSVDVYFQYRKTGAGTWISTTKQSKTATGTFSANISSLDAATEYEFRAVVEWDSGAETAYGDVAYFETEAATEYCEYVADLLRTTIKDYIYIADLSREIEKSLLPPVLSVQQINGVHCLTWEVG